MFGSTVYGGVFEVGGSNGANSGLTNFNRYPCVEVARPGPLYIASHFSESNAVSIRRRGGTSSCSVHDVRIFAGLKQSDR